MRGSLVRRGKNRYAIVLDMGYVTDPATGQRKRKQKWITFRGPKKGPGGAEEKLTELVRAANRDEFVEPTKLTLGGWLQTWLAKAVVPPLRRPATCAVYESIVRNHLTDSQLARMPLQKVRATDLETYYASLTAAASTISVHHAILHQALRMAVRDRLLLSNPAAEVEYRPKTKTADHADAREHCWPAADARAFLDAAKRATPQIAAFFALALDTGARKSELLGLTWDKVDGARVAIDRQLLRDGTFGPTKTGRTRRVDVDAATVALLRVHKREQAALKMANRTAYDDGAFVFAKEPGDLQTPAARLGQPLTIAIVGGVFARLTKAANVRRIRFHGLRHTSATLHLAAGMPVNDVAARLGHAKASMTLDVYGHALPGGQATAAARAGVGALLHG